MYSFRNDYSEGCHPRILQSLQETNLTQQEGYGEDAYCAAAKTLIREHIQCPNADIHFVTGGTQANIVAISSMLKPYESVISAVSSHIAMHEAGAIEAAGHKINTVNGKNGKINCEQILDIVNAHIDEHMVSPKVVFISNSTELGAVYSQSELQAISETCKKNGLLLYLDGARLGSALTSSASDLTMPQIAKLTDMFYIGGAKNGALLGEAIVITNENLKKHFRFHLKQRGALLSKGRVLGLQFKELFKDALFYDLGRKSNHYAAKLAKTIGENHYSFLTEPQTNQLFPIFPNGLIEKLSKKFEFYTWEKVNERNSAIRLVTSWATRDEAIDEFEKEIKTYSKRKPVPNIQ
jgi:threonine aldolase